MSVTAQQGNRNFKMEILAKPVFFCELLLSDACDSTQEKRLNCFLYQVFKHRLSFKEIIILSAIKQCIISIQSKTVSFMQKLRAYLSFEQIKAAKVQNAK